MRRSLQTLIALLLLAHLGAAEALAASPHWHHEIHHDADESTHECAISLFARGSVNLAAPPPLAPVATLQPVLETPPTFPETARPQWRTERLRGRAPPLADR